MRNWRAARSDKSDPRQSFYLGGYAGTGKTTLAREFARDLGGHVEFAAFTGKAALVLRQAGCDEARTIHSLIYSPVDKSRKRLADLKEQLEEMSEDHPKRWEILESIKDEEKNLKRPSFTLKLDSPITDAVLTIVDEVSMVDQQMGADLCSFGVDILVLGDPAQLPPVAKGSGYFTSRSPDFMLTEIHRQAADSPVLRLATAVREGKGLQAGEYGTSRVLPAKSVKPEDALGFDQIIVGKNETRKLVNIRLREVLGRKGPLPEEGDKLVCLRNNHELGLLNGSLWKVLHAGVADEDLMDLWIQDTDSGERLTVTAHRHHFEGRDLPWFKARDAEEFDYGYAITCHKAQGSQWPKVLIYDQSWIAREHRNKWLYTALTRASQSVTVVQS